MDQPEDKKSFEARRRKNIPAAVKFFSAAIFAVADIFCFCWGMFCMYGGGEGNINRDALAYAVLFWGMAAIFAMFTLLSCRFSRKICLVSAITHEILLLFFVLTGVLTAYGANRDDKFWSVQLLACVFLFAGGYAIYCLTKKSGSIASRNLRNFIRKSSVLRSGFPAFAFFA